MEQIIVAERSDVQQSGFDYSQLDEATAKFAWQCAQEIRWDLDIAGNALVSAGKKLIGAKDRIPSGCWLIWLQSEFGWSPSHAAGLIRIARSFGDVDLRRVATSVTALKLLSMPSLPPEVVQRARDRIIAGDPLSVDDARDIIRPFDPEMADTWLNHYWEKRRRQEVKNVQSAAAEFHAAVRNLQIVLADVYDPVHPRVKRAVDKLTALVAVIMESDPDEKAPPKFNRRRSLEAKSKYWGVSQETKSGKWRARIAQREGQFGKETRLYLGLFDTELAAAHAYDTKARELYGDKARLNFPDEQV